MYFTFNGNGVEDSFCPYGFVGKSEAGPRLDNFPIHGITSLPV